MGERLEVAQQPSAPPCLLVEQRREVVEAQRWWPRRRAIAAPLPPLLGLAAMG